MVWGLATAHEIYHPNPLRGKKLDRYYGEFVRVGHALGGTDLPTTKAETLDCLKSYLPRLALTHGAAMATGPNLPMPQGAVDWAIRDTMPTWAKQLIEHADPNVVERTARRAAVWSVINGLHTAAGAIPEFRAGPGPRRRRHDRPGAAHRAGVRAGQRPRAQPRPRSSTASPTSTSLTHAVATAVCFAAHL